MKSFRELAAEEFTPDELAEMRRHTRVSIPMSEWATFAPLIEGWVDALLTAKISVEDDDAPDEQLYCIDCDAKPADVLAVIEPLLPTGFTADVVPVPERSLAGAEIAISRH